MERGRLGGLWWRFLAAGVPAGVAGVAVWALVADDKAGWTVVAGATAAVAGGFGPSVGQWVTARRERRERQGRVVAGVLVAELPASVAWLLHPQAAVIRFFGRGWVLRELQAWCADPDASPVRLVVGGGGVGKTRLARHFATGMAGWTWWPVAPQGEARVAQLVADGEAPARLLLVVDYAETRDPASLAALLCTAQQAGGVRVLLLARTAGLWWSTLSAAYPEQAHLVDALTMPAHVIELPAGVEERDPSEIVADAVGQFADHLRYAPPVQFTPLAHDSDTPVLRLHAEALVAVLGGPRDGGRYDVLAEVVSHEARYWRGCARRAGLLAADDATSRDAVLRQVVGIAALLGADDDEQAAGIVRRAPLLNEDTPAPVVDGLVRWLRNLYPPVGSGGALGTLQPDLLAEGLAVAVLRDCAPAEQVAVFSGLPRSQAVRALTLLGRACAHQPDAVGVIEVALSADVPVMTEAVLQIGTQFPGRFAPRVANLLTTTTIDPEWARVWAEQVPYPSLELGEIAEALTARVLSALPPTTPPQIRAAWLNRHTLRLKEVGRRAEALAASEEAVNLRRELAATDRDAHLSDLATSVNNHAVRLAEAGRRTEALTASEEGIHLYRELAATNRYTHLSDLAMSVNNHAVQLAEAGRRTEALTASEEAVNLCRELAATDRDAHLPNLAMAVNNHTVRLAEAGRRTEALTASEEAVNLCRELAATNRDAHLPKLATSVNNHALHLAASGLQTEARAASEEAVNLRRELAATNRDAHLPDLAWSVNNHAVRLAEAGLYTEARAASEEAIHLYRGLAAANRDAYLPKLAKSLLGAGVVGLVVGDTSNDIVALTAEGVQHLEALAAAEPAAFAPLRDLAASTLAELRRVAGK
ncbi:hypothetical protein [Micromonospora sp. CA-111912]|uniref:hypothetical protein n=1 Tax=Micromonospora sp. CA-111912 TaxID=3239955 RepID=UPI003D8CC92F